MEQFKVGDRGITVQDFIEKWNVAYEDKEQQTEFAREMEADLDDLARTNLRDQFAMSALSGLLSKWVDGYNNDLNVKQARKKLALKCYKIADAMLTQRKTPNENMP
jgi:hypothetical protein